MSIPFKPSLTDVFVVAIVFMLFLSDPAGWERLVWDGDTGLHTRTGDYILDHGQVPVNDPFSFTKPGQRWYALQWLSGVMFAGLNRWLGLKGIVLLCGAALIATLLILLRQMLLMGANGLVSMLAVLAAGNAMTIHLHARPHIFTLLLLAATMYLLEKDRMQPGRTIWVIVPLAALWANLHSGFPVLLAVLGMAAAGSVLSRDWARARRFAILLALASSATLLNPNGIGLHAHIVSFINDPWTVRHVNEYKPPRFDSEPMWYFLGFLVAGAYTAGAMACRRQWTHALWLCAFGLGSLLSARHVPLLLIVAAPLAAVEASRFMVWLAARGGRKSTAAAVAEIAAALTARLRPASVWALVVPAAIAAASTNFPTDLSAKYFPRAMVSKHAGDLAAARVFTTDQWGDYLLWRNYPRQRVFMDGRSDYFQAEIGDPYLRVHGGAPGWEQVLALHNVELVLAPTDIPLARVIGQSRHWTLVDQDPQAVLYRRR